MKQFYRWLNSFILKDKTLNYKLNIIFCLFFFGPVAGLIFFGIHYDILTDRYLPAFFMILLGFSFLGLNLLRKVFDEISGFSSKLSLRLKQSFPDEALADQRGDELHRLGDALGVLDGQLEELQTKLWRKNNEIGVLKGLADLCYVTADPDEILYLALERALAMTGSDVGSILFLERPGRDYFVVRAAIGHDQVVQVNDRITFESSIAKYAVLNKAALLVEDVEKDSRFGRANLSHYATKSFVCLPIKTSREIIGVITISSKSQDRVYSNEDVDMLEPLLSNAAFTYENLLLTRDSKKVKMHISAIANMLEIVNSSFRGSEMLQACLNEIHDILPVELMLLLQYDPERPGEIVLFDLLAAEPTLLSKDQHLVMAEGSILEKMLDLQTSMYMEETSFLAFENGLQLTIDQQQYGAIVVPMKMQGITGGFLLLMGKQPFLFSREHTFIEWAARCLSLGIERNRLYNAVAKRNRELDSLRQIGSALASSTFDIKQVLNYTMDMIRLIMNVEAGAIYLVDEKELAFAVSFNIDEKKRKPLRLKLGQGIPGYVAARGEPMMVNESHGTSFFMPEINSEKDLPIHSALCVPMISQGKVIGVIEVLNKNIGDFVTGDQELLQSIASSVSIAIENANLYKETVAMAENERGIRRVFQKFVPKEVLEKILHGTDGGLEMTEELKTLTLINIDIRGFSFLVKSLGPQKSVALLNAFFSVMGSIVFKHHGIVDKYLGDGFLAIFGAPVSSVADADNAITAALEMQKSLDLVNSSIAKDMGKVLKIGISIHTGEAVVGNIGFDMKMDYTVIGDSVNDVFRLQDMVRPFPNAILMSQNTLRATRLSLNYIEHDERLGQLKIYELLGRA